VWESHKNEGNKNGKGNRVRKKLSSGEEKKRGGPEPARNISLRSLGGGGGLLKHANTGLGNVGIAYQGWGIKVERAKNSAQKLENPEKLKS